MKRLGLAAVAMVLLAVPAVAQKKFRWSANDWKCSLLIERQFFMVMQSGKRVDLVPMQSAGFLLSGHIILNTVYGMSTVLATPHGGWMNNPTGTLHLTTHADAALHHKALGIITRQPVPSAQKPRHAQLSTHWVDTSGFLQTVHTVKGRSESNIAWIKRHQALLKEMLKIAPLDRKETKAWLRGRNPTNPAERNSR